MTVDALRTPRPQDEMDKAPFTLKWQVDLGQEILPRPPAVLGDVAVLPLAGGLAWVKLATGRVAHVEGLELRVLAVLTFGDGVVAALQDGAATLVDRFDAAGRRRWRSRVDLGAGIDCLQAGVERVLVIGSDARGLQAAWLDVDGREQARWPVCTADLRLHEGIVYGALPTPVDGRAGVMRLADGPPMWCVDAPAFRWALDGADGVLDTWNGWQADSELVGFSLADGAVRFRAAGGPNERLLPEGGQLAHLESAPGGPVAVLRTLHDGAVRWRSAPVGSDSPGLFGRCSGAATLQPDDVVVWLHGRCLVRLARADGAHRGEEALPSLPPAGVTATAHGLLLRHNRLLTMVTLTP